MVKKTIILFLVFCSCALAQDTRTYTVGATSRQFSTYTAAESDKNQDLVANDSLLTFEGYNDAALDEHLVIAGWTTDATRYAIWTVASGERHDGTRGTGLKIDPSTNGHCIEVSADFMRIEYLELTGVTGSSDEGVRVNSGADDNFLKWLLIYDLELSSSDGIYTGNWAVSNLNIEGCIIIDCDRACIHMQNFNGTNAQTVNIKHTTVLGGNTGGTADTDRGGIVNQSQDSGSSVTITCDNVIVMNTSTTDDYESDGGSGTETWAGSFNMSEDGTANEDGMTSGVLNQTYADQFTSTTANAENIKLKSGNDAEDAGHTVTLQTAEDYLETSIPQNSVHDIGANEVVSVVAVTRRKWKF